MTDRDELATDLEAIADMPRTALELFAYGMKVERDALQAVVDTDIAFVDAYSAHLDAANDDHADPAEVDRLRAAHAAALFNHDAALDRYRKEHQ